MSDLTINYNGTGTEEYVEQSVERLQVLERELCLRIDGAISSYCGDMSTRINGFNSLAKKALNAFVHLGRGAFMPKLEVLAGLYHIPAFKGVLSYIFGKGTCVYSKEKGIYYIPKNRKSTAIKRLSEFRAQHRTFTEIAEQLINEQKNKPEKEQDSSFMARVDRLVKYTEKNFTEEQQFLTAFKEFLANYHQSR